MSIRPGGQSTPSKAERLIVRNMAGLVLVALVLLLGGIIVAAVLRSQAHAIDVLETKVKALEAQQVAAPDNAGPNQSTAITEPRETTNEQPSTPDESAPSDDRSARSERTRSVTKRSNESTSTRTNKPEREIISALRNVIQADTYGRLALIDAEGGTKLLAQIDQAAQRKQLSPRVLARGAVLAMLLDQMELGQKLLDQAQAGDAPTTTYYETLARKRLVEGQTDAAIAAATHLADQTDNSPTALVLLAQAQRLRDETGSLAKTLAFSHSWSGLTLPDQLLLARAFAETEDTEQLKATLAALPTQIPDELRSAVDELLAIAQLFAGDAEPALAKLEELNQAEGEDFDRAVWTGRAMLELGRRSDARTAFTKAAELAPNRAAGHYWLGQMAMTERDAKAADSYLEKAVSVAPQYAQAWQAWGTLALNNGELEPAFERLTNAIEAAPQLAQPHFIMAIALAKSDRKEETAEALRRAIERDPSLAENARLSGVFQKVFTAEELEALLNVDPQPSAS